jgi:hypothetical protein
VKTRGSSATPKRRAAGDAARAALRPARSSDCPGRGLRW